MIEVKNLGQGQYEISWDENTYPECLLNDWSEQDFISCIQDSIEYYSKNNDSN